MPGIRGIGQKAPTRRPVLATRPLWCKHAGGRKGPKIVKPALVPTSCFKAAKPSGRRGSQPSVARSEAPNHEIARLAAAVRVIAARVASPLCLDGSVAAAWCLLGTGQIRGRTMKGDQDRPAGKSDADVRIHDGTG